MNENWNRCIQKVWSKYVTSDMKEELRNLQEKEIKYLEKSLKRNNNYSINYTEVKDNFLDIHSWLSTKD